MHIKSLHIIIIIIISVKRSVDDAEYFVNVADDALCYVNIGDSSSQTEAESCDVLSSSTKQSVISIRLTNPAMIAFGRFFVESCDSDAVDQLDLQLHVAVDGDFASQHTVRGQTLFLQVVFKFSFCSFCRYSLWSTPVLCDFAEVYTLCEI